MGFSRHPLRTLQPQPCAAWVLGLLGPLLLLTLPSQAQPTAASTLELLSSNPAAGESARYGFVLPERATAALQQSGTLQLIFAADLDVDAYQRLLQLCYLSDRRGRRPARSRCVERIPARISVQVSPAADIVTIETQQPLDAARPKALWVDLINPIEPGRYAVLLRSGDEPLGSWSVRVEQPSYDG